MATEAEQLAKLAELTSFTPDELANMAANFKNLATSQNQVMDKAEFRKMMGDHGDSVFVDGLFRMFDHDNNGTIDFTEFVLSLAIYQNKAKHVPENDKKKLFFKIFDVDGDGEISQNDLATVLQSCFQSSFMAVGDEEIRNLVAGTFQKYELTQRGTIDFTSFSKAAFSHRSGYM